MLQPLSMVKYILLFLFNQQRNLIIAEAIQRYYNRLSAERVCQKHFPLSNQIYVWDIPRWGERSSIRISKFGASSRSQSCVWFLSLTCKSMNYDDFLTIILLNQNRIFFTSGTIETICARLQIGLGPHREWAIMKNNQYCHHQHHNCHQHRRQ